MAPKKPAKPVEPTAKLPVLIIVHPIIDKDKLLVGPGVPFSRHGSRENARKSLARALDGCLFKGPFNVARIVENGDDLGEWWFMGDKSTYHGSYVNLSLGPCRHRGDPITVQETAETPAEATP